MTKSLKKQNMWIMSAFIILLTHVAAIFSGVSMALDILGPLGLFFIAIALMSPSREIKTHHQEFRKLTLFYALVCIAWGIAETGWIFVSIWGNGNPSENSILNTFYFAANLFMLIAMGNITAFLFQKWDKALLVADILINLFFGGNVFWILFFNGDIENVKRFLAQDYVGILSILIDIFITVIVFSLLFSLFRTSGSAGKYIALIGVILFTGADTLFYYLQNNNLYEPDTIADLLYYVSLDTIALGILLEKKRLTQPTQVFMRGNAKRIPPLYILIYPIMLIFGFKLGHATYQLTFHDFTNMASVLLIYVLMVRYIEKSSAIEDLLKKDKIRLEREREEQAQRTAYLNDHDPITDTYNRNYFLKMLHEYELSASSQQTVLVTIVEVEQLNSVYEVFGYESVNVALKKIADKLRDYHEQNAVVARISFDQFAVKMIGNYTQESAAQLCKSIKIHFSDPIFINDIPLYFSFSIGAALSVKNEFKCSSLMQNASIALRQAKSAGNNTFILASSHTQSVANLYRQQEIMISLEQAIREKNFSLYFQPQFELPSKKIIGAEALIRWNTAKYGFIAPSVFIPLAEATGGIKEIGKWVFHEVVQQIRQWNTTHNLNLQISFNISTIQLKDGDFLNFLIDEFEKYDINPKWLDAEITESATFEESRGMDDFIGFCKKKGISVSLDDFGTGFSTLSNLHKYSYNRVKIDKSLIDELSTGNERGKNFIQSIIQMTHICKSKCLAEGVESEEQLNILISLGCDQIQGYVLGKPVPADIFERDNIMANSVRSVLEKEMDNFDS